MKIWEQITIAISLASLGVFLWQRSMQIKASMVNTAQYGGMKQWLFMSLNQIDHGFALPPGAANDVPLDQISAGQAYANGFVPLDNYVP